MTPHRPALLAALLLVPAAARAGEPPVGLGLYLANGRHQPLLDPAAPAAPLRIVDGPPRYLQELTLISRLPTAADPDPLVMLAPVMTGGDLAGLDWRGVRPVPAAEGGEDWRLQADGVRWMRSIYFRDAAWMLAPSVVAAVPVDAGGAVAGEPLVGFAGFDRVVLPALDDFFERRFVARVVAKDCPARGDCTGATWTAEGLVQLRAATHAAARARVVPGRASALLLLWTADLANPRRVELVHEAATPALGYGLTASLALVEPPPSGVYQPGDTVTFRVTFRDAAGRRLFPEGTLPSYGDALFGAPAAAGLQYLNFADDPILYWAHKNVQSDMEYSFGGPVHRVAQVGSSSITPFDLFAPQIAGATRAADGYHALLQILPPSALVFGCLLGVPFPDAVCFAPAEDRFAITIPADAEAGTWTAQLKARRLWGGEPVQAAAQLDVQVGSATPTAYTPRTGGCAGCHAGPTAVAAVGHGFAGDGVGPWCFTCHTGRGPDYPTGHYYFEPDAGIDIRVHRVHALSRRYAALGGDLEACASCHLAPPSGPARR